MKAYPGKARELGAFFSKQILPYTPNNAARVEIWDLCYDAAGTRLVKGTVNEDHVLAIAKRDVDLAKVDRVVTLNSEKAIPVLEENIVHYEGRHVTGTLKAGEPGTTLFPATEQVVWDIGGSSVTYPGKSLATQAEVKAVIPDWIDRAIKSEGYSEWPKQVKNVRLTLSEAEQAKYGVREIEVAINPNTGVASVYPLNGPEVYKWFSGKWNAIP